MTNNFSILIAGQSVAAAPAANATAVAIDVNPPTGVVRSDVMIYNPGPGTVYVRAGDGNVLADANCQPILAGEKGAWHKGAATHLAAYSPSGAQTLLVFVGAGA